MMFTSALSPKGNSSYSYTSQRDADARCQALDANGCVGCVSCVDCWGCRGCKNCKNCVSCKNCKNCMDCVSCVSCKNCVDCRSCVDCRGCVTNWSLSTREQVPAFILVLKTSNVTFSYTDVDDATSLTWDEALLVNARLKSSTWFKLFTERSTVAQVCA